MKDTLFAILMTALSLFIWFVIGHGLFDVIALASTFVATVITAIWVLFGMPSVLFALTKLLDI